ncbi:amine oxidase [Deltaproteobacteria bacterium]|nr:amine oxidase [Deltaproteobacteria bacterium]
MRLPRRRFLQGLAAGPLVATLPVVGCAARGEGLRVVVIGAGAAGLYAGWTLQDEGATVTILEASAVHGGRLRVLEGFADFPIELGAEEVHGERSILHTLLVADGARFVDADDADVYFVDGERRGEGVLEEDDFADAEAFVDALGDWEGDDVTIAARIADEGLAARTDFLTDAWIGNEYGAQNDLIGARSLAQGDAAWTAGDTNFALDGTTLLGHLESALAAVLPAVKTGQAVTRVDHDADGVTVTCADGTTYAADAVIVAVPITVLRDGDITFSPALPDDKLTAIGKVPMGAGMKVVLSFARRFWDADTGSIYGAAHVPEFWATGLGRSAENLVLTAFVMGDKAEALSALGDDAIATVLADLDAIYGAGVASGAYVDGVIQDWLKEPTIRGAYSYPGPGSHAARAIVAEAVGETVYFAGEATHTEGHFGTVHGALETGERAAEAVLTWWWE